MIRPLKERYDEELEKLKMYQCGEINPIPTGREWLDSVFGGLIPGDIVTLAGPAASGKSFELQRVKNNIMNKELNPDAEGFVWLDYSLEMRVMSLIIRDLNIKLKKSKKKILKEEFTEEEKALAKDYYENMTDGRFFIEEDAPSPSDFRKGVRKFLEANKDKKAVFIAIDHIALSKSDEGRKKNSVDAIVEIINDFKKEFHNTHWFILSQLNREIDKRIAEKDNRSMPIRGDLYQSDTMFHISDYLYVSYNPFKFGIKDFSRFNMETYDYLEKHFSAVDYSKGRASFDTLGKIFYIVLKVREQEAIYKDVFIEEINIPNKEKYRIRDEKTVDKKAPDLSQKVENVKVPTVDFSSNNFENEKPF